MIRSPIAVLLTTGLVAFAQTGVVTGRVIDGKGNPVAGAAVAAQPQLLAPGVKLTGIAGRGAPFTAKAPTGSDGSFEMDGLPPGTFELCAEAPASEVLNPCVWGGTKTVAAALAGKTVSGTLLKVSKGVTVLVRMSDVSAALLKNPAADDIRVGTHQGAFRFLGGRVVARDPSGKTVAIVVPAGQSMEVLVRSEAFSLADSKGNLLGAGFSAFPLAAPVVSPTVSSPDLSKAPPHLTLQVIAKTPSSKP